MTIKAFIDTHLIFFTLLLMHLCCAVASIPGYEYVGSVCIGVQSSQVFVLLFGRINIWVTEEAKL